MPPPLSTTALSSFLGMTNIYARFTLNYSEVTSPLRRLLKKDVSWDWSSGAHASFGTLNQKITEAPVLAHFSTEAATWVTCDASANAVGAVLSQATPQGERHVAFASCALSEAMKKYSVSEKEAFACVFASEHWDLYLCGRPFVLRTDHQALLTLLNSLGSGHRPLRLHRWFARLLRYTFRVELFVAGSSKKVAEFLCRSTQSPLPVHRGFADDADEDAIQVFSVDVFCHTLNRDQVAEATSADEDLRRVAAFVTSG